jgi:signal transduction histidine kinase
LVIGLDERDFLQNWRNNLRKDIGFLSMFAIFGSVLSYFALTMAHQIRRVEESEASAVMASQAKSEFLANMSHELRTPLNAIIGFSEMMDAGYFGKLTPKQKERVHDIHLCGTHLLQLINDILEFSKAEAGKMELHEEHFDPQSIIDECVRIIDPRAQAKGLNVHVSVQKNLPRIIGDSRKTRQLLLNLLTNAVKFTDAGDVYLSVQTVGERGLEIKVRDTGIGMRTEDIPQALSVFGQVHRDTHPEGSGLGLPLCRIFAELHGGELRIESAPRKGTTVVVLLPAYRLDYSQTKVIGQ